MSFRIFEEPSDSSFSTDTTGNTADLPAVLSIQDVRIVPGHMHFENAYDGKSYAIRMIIQNCGRKSAFIRLLPCSSAMFQYESFERGAYLSPGMKIIRTVKCTYKASIGTVTGLSSIWINDEEIVYKFFVTLSKAVLVIEPQIIDFQKMDAVNHTCVRSFCIKNEGSRASNFAIDLGRNPLQLSVHPMKGTVHAKSSVTVTVEIVGTEGGDFLEEFWIKANPPKRVLVKGTFVAPKLVVRKFISRLDFKFLDFLPTYYGSSRSELVLVKNESPSNSMFCVMAEIKNTIMTLEDARKVDVCYQNFDIVPKDGRIKANKGSIIQIVFTPKVTRPININYAACFFKIIRMDCRDVEDENIYETDNVVDLPTREDSFSLSGITEYSYEEIIASPFAVSIDDKNNDGHLGFEHAVKVCVHGEKAIAGVDLTPSKIHLKELTLERDYERTVLVKNRSNKLPIKLKYNKVGGVYTRPAEFDLEPSGSLEVLLLIHTSNYGNCHKQVTFDLFSSSKSLNESITMKVGSTTIKIYLEVSEVAKKTRVNKCLLCTDLIEKLAPKLPYRVDDKELEKKIQHDDYYIDYIRNLRNEPLKNDFEGYALTGTKIMKCQEPQSKKNSQKVPKTTLIPLTPSLLYNIKIIPKSIRLRNITVYTTVGEYFEIHNNNTFPIRVFVKPSKSNIVFDNGGRFVIQSREKKKIHFSFSTTTVGRYYGNISVLINDSTLYEVTTVAYAVLTTLNVDVHNLVFKEFGRDYRFIRLSNPFSSFVDFAWELEPGCFQVYPTEAVIPPKKSMLCMVSFDPNPYHFRATDCILTVENVQINILPLSYKKEQPSVAFDTYNIDLKEIPLNLPKQKKITMKNLKKSKIYFLIDNPIPLPGVTIEPKSGTVEALGTQVFTIKILINAVIKFHTEVLIIINEKLKIGVSLTGNVEYPQINVSPKQLIFRKIVPHSFDIQAFKIENLSICECLISFSRIDFPEFSITSSEEHHPHMERILLSAKESRLLYAHFHPKYICTNSFVLNYMTNDILGPVQNEDNTTMSFLQKNTQIYESISCVDIKKIPDTLTTIRISAVALEKKIKLSSLEIDFKYFGEGHHNNVTQCDFVITNVSDEIASVCIRTEPLTDSCFSMVAKSEEVSELSNVSFKFDIKPKEETIFEVNFNPSGVGEYMVKIPIFLRNYYDNKIFNYLTIKGIHKNPSITMSKKQLDFEPVPLNFNSKTSLILEMEDHFDNCQLLLETDVDFIFLGDRREVKNDSSTLEVDLISSCIVGDCFDKNLTLKCTCGSSCVVRVTGVVENCLLTTHVFSHFLRRSRYVLPSLSDFNMTSYPFFPSDDDDFEYEKYMRDIQTVLENWVFSQGFYQTEYYKIPEGFTNFFREDYIRSRFGRKRVSPKELPLVRFVANFIGKTFKKELNEEPPDSTDEVAWFSYTCHANSKILHYLRGFSIFVPHIESKFLLNYDQYLFYEKTKRPNANPLDESVFYRLSKQSWIDLILQIIKAFVLFRTVPENFNEVKKTPQDSLSNTSNVDPKVNFLDTGIYGPHELFLLSWLQNIYDSEKETLWGSKAKDIEVIYLDDSLHDGLVLGAATAHFCPYVKKDIQNMFHDPQTTEEFHHNACTLVQTWDKLNLSYVIKPNQILNGTMVQMLLLVTYLYNVLPDLLPKEKIIIETNLTQTKKKCIDLENKGQDTIFYKTIFFGNEHNQFEVSPNIIKIDSRKTKTISVRYHARSVQTTTVTLLLSGEIPGQKYAKSLVVTLEGIPDVSYVCSEIPVVADLYRLCTLSIPIVSPFKKKIHYALLVSYQPINSQENVLYPYATFRTSTKVSEIIFENDSCDFDEKGLWTLTATTCLRQVGPRIIWIYFTNPEVGDWGVKLILTGRVISASYEDIDVWIPSNYNSLVCRCKHKVSVDKNCPKIIQIELPKKNKPLWRARKAMVLYQISDEEREFWSERLYTPTGTRILRLIMVSEDYHLSENLDERVEYETEVAKQLVTVSKVTVEDVLADDTFTIPIHPVRKKDLLSLEKCTLRLNAICGTENRFYNLHFKCASEYDQKKNNVIK